MTKCSYCGKDELLPFQCPFCLAYFCSEHRLPENHNCAKAPLRTPLGSWQIRQDMERFKKEGEVEKEKFVSNGAFHFIKKELPKVDLTKKPKKSKRRFWKRDKK